MKGGGIAGAATVGGAGVEVAQEALAEASGRVAELVPYLDVMRWVFVALALAVLLFMLSLRRAGERAGRANERLDRMETAHDVRRRMLDAVARRPRDRDAPAGRLRTGRF